MAYEVGGRADKFGNRFENNWIISKLLDVIEEKAKYVILEALGRDESGVDVWVVDKNDIREGQQCKGRNGSKECWTFSDLNEKGIWRNWKTQLDRGDNIRMALVSPLPFTNLEDITTRARNNNDNAHEFYNIQINESGKRTRNLFRDICDIINIDLSTDDGCIKALDYFRRIYCRQYPDSEAKVHILERINRLFIGDAECIYALLLDYVLSGDVYGKELNIFLLKRVLEENKVHFRNLAHDERILPKIREINEDYKASFNKFSIGLVLRREARICWDTIQKGQSVIIHGQAGSGKSGCTANIIEICEANCIPYVAVRLDQHIPRNNTEDWGRDLGLPASLSHCLAAVDSKQPAAIILDQLDALRWTQAHSSTALSVCHKLIREVASLNEDRLFPISLIFVCRTYDLENDTAIKNLFENSNQEISWKKQEIGYLDDSLIKQVIGVSYDNLSIKTKQLLKLASNLYVWERLDRRKDYDHLVATHQLIQEWWKQIIGKAVNNSLESPYLEQIKNKMVEYCDYKGVISIPAIVLGIPDDYKGFLRSQGFILEYRSKIAFSHQTILDCFLADHMTRRYYLEHRVKDIIGEKKRQTPGRRYQTQIFLQQLLDQSEKDFVNAGNQLLNSPDIRYSFKYVFLELLSQIDNPNSDTLKYVVSTLFQNPDWEMPVLNTIIRGQSIYVKYFIQKGILETWMNDQDKRIAAINLCASISPEYGPLEIGFIKQYALQTSGGKDWISCFNKDINEGSDDFFEMRLNYYKQNPNILHQYLDYRHMLERCEIRTARIIALMLELKAANHECTIYRNAENFVCDETEINVDDYKTVLEILLPVLPRVNKENYCNEWSNRYVKRNNLERICVILVKAANRKFAEMEPQAFLGYYDFCFSKGDKFYNELLLDAMLYLGTDYSDFVLDYLQSDLANNLFEDTSGNGDKLLSAKLLVNKYSESCTDDVLKRFEHKVTHFIDPKAKDDLQKRREVNKKHREEHERWVFWNFWGDFQLEILSAIVEQRRSRETVNLLITLRRRDAGKPSKYIYKDRFDFCNVVSPVSGKRISVNAWMDIILNAKIQSIHKTKWLYERGICVESSLEEFVSSFRNFVSQNPCEISKRILNTDSEIQSCFIDALFNGLATSQELDDVSNQTIECLIEKYGYDYDSFRAAYICEIVEKKHDRKWSQSIELCLNDIALNHHNTEIDKPVVSSANDREIKTVEMLETNALNCAKGYAFRAMSSLLWDDKRYFEKFKAVIQKSAIDINTVVNTLCFGHCIPLIILIKTGLVKALYRYSQTIVER